MFYFDNMTISFLFQMARLHNVVLGILILQMYVHAAPNDVSNVEDIAEIEQTERKLDLEPKEIESDSNSSDHTVTEATDSTQRQKRWYNPYGYGFPPINPLIYPGFNKRDEGPNTGFYGGEDPIAQIHRRIQEIANIVRQPPPPPPPHIPIFYPVLFIPSGDCRCTENTTPGSNTTPTDSDQATPTIANRWPVMEDERQNWGLIVNETDIDDGQEFSRPISFDPIRLNRPARPPPPVEHGSVQSDSNNSQGQSQTTAASFQAPAPPPQNAPPSLNRPENSTPSQNRPGVGLAPPSRCDGAILTCCHQPQVVYDCFAIQGCPDFTAYGNPCDSSLILRVIEKFQTFYGQKAG